MARVTPEMVEKAMIEVAIKMEHITREDVESKQAAMSPGDKQQIRQMSVMLATELNKQLPA